MQKAMVQSSERSHANGWLATVLHDQGRVEGYLWDEFQRPIGRCHTGYTQELTQWALDEMVEQHGHTCSHGCGEWVPRFHTAGERAQL